MLPLTSCFVQQPRSGRLYQGCCDAHKVLIELYDILRKVYCQGFLQYLLRVYGMRRDSHLAEQRGKYCRKRVVVIT